MKCSLLICWLAALVPAIAWPVLSVAQADNEEVAHLRVDSSFVWIPALVNTKNHGALTHLNIGQLRLLDNGHPEKLTQIDNGGLPISLVILMQTGGSASRFLPSYSNLPWLIGRLLGDSIHEITLVTFDSRIEQIWHFPTRTDGATYAMTHQRPGDEGAAIKDAVAFGVRQLQDEPGRFRRIVLLLSQEVDVGSSTPSQTLLEQLGSSSTVIYSISFSGERKPARMSKVTHGYSNEQTIERVKSALDGRTAEEAARLTGGTEHEFADQSGFNSTMLDTLRDFHNGITLGFQPSHPQLGFHRLEVLADSSKLRVLARNAYWVAPSN